VESLFRSAYVIESGTEIIVERGEEAERWEGEASTGDERRVRGDLAKCNE
jgi:hypothetical protein